MADYRCKKGELLHGDQPVDIGPQSALIEEFRGVLRRTPAFRSKWTALAGALLYQLENQPSRRAPTPPPAPAPPREPEPAPVDYTPPTVVRASRQLCQTTGKRMFGSKSTARASNTSNGARIRVYHCDDCGSYHVTKAES